MISNWKFDPEQKSGTLSVESELTIKFVGELKEGLVEAFSQADSVTVDLSGAEVFDVAGIQLLCACHRYTVGRGKEMSLDVGGNTGFQDFLDSAGFTHDFVCSHGKDSRCLWVENF